jgi:type IV secretion system protein VirB2
VNVVLATSLDAKLPTSRWAIAVCIGLVLFLTPEPAFAQSNVNNMARAILDLLTGPLARTFAAIAVVVCGFLYFTGRGSAQALISVIVGCFLVFSAEWLVGLIAG